MTDVTPMMLPNELSEARRMSFEEFDAIVARRPDHEHWELVEGYPVMMTPPVFLHQRIVLNVLRALLPAAATTREWEVLPGIGLSLKTEASAVVPDIAIIRPPANSLERWSDDALVVFEVLSPSTRDRDLRWKRTVYSRLPSLLYYVMIEQNEPLVRFAARSDAFRITDVTDGALHLPELGLQIPVDAIYGPAAHQR